MRIRKAIAGPAAIAAVIAGALIPIKAQASPAGDWFHLTLRASQPTTVSYTLKWRGKYFDTGPAVAGNAVASSSRPLAVGASEVDQDGELSVLTSFDGSSHRLAVRPYSERELWMTSFGAVRIGAGEVVHVAWFITNATMTLDSIRLEPAEGQLSHQISAGSGSTAISLDTPAPPTDRWVVAGPIAGGSTTRQFKRSGGVGAFLPCSYCEANATAPGGAAFPTSYVDEQPQGFQGFAGPAGGWHLEWSGVRANANGRPTVAVHVPLSRWADLAQKGVSRIK